MLSFLPILFFSSGLAPDPSVASAPPPPAPEVNADLGSNLVKANQAYDDGQYATAVELYSHVVDVGVQNGYLYFNLGNAFLRAGRLGHAIAAYRQSLALLPRNSDAHANLAFARKSTKDALAPDETAGVLRTLFFWHFFFSRQELCWLLIAANALFWLALLLRQLKREMEVWRWAALLLFPIVAAIGVSAVWRTLSPHRIVVVNAHEAEVRSGLSRDAVVRFKLHAGAEAEWVDSENGWVRIRLADGKQGWMEDDQVLVLTL